MMVQVRLSREDHDQIARKNTLLVIALFILLTWQPKQLIRISICDTDGFSETTVEATVNSGVKTRVERTHLRPAVTRPLLSKDSLEYESSLEDNLPALVNTRSTSSNIRPLLTKDTNTVSEEENIPKIVESLEENVDELSSEQPEKNDLSKDSSDDENEMLAEPEDDSEDPFFSPTSSIDIDSRKTAIVHVGPHRTGMKSIQSMLRTVYADVEMDNYAFLDPISTFATCFLSPLDPYLKAHQIHACDANKLDEAKEFARLGKNVIFSSGIFDRPFMDLEALSEFLNDWEDVKVVIYYRRYYDYLQSVHYTHAKTTGLMAVARPSIVDVLQSQTWITVKEEQYTLQLVKRYKKYFKNVEIRNMHDTSVPLAESFVCDVMSDARTACLSVQKRADKHSNPSPTNAYKEIAYQANRLGMITIVDDLDLKLAADRIEQHHKNLLKTDEDLKKICLPPNVKEELFQKSLEIEKDLVPEFFSTPEGEAALRADFNKQSTVGRLCAVDAVAALAEPEWQEYFSSW